MSILSEQDHMNQWETYIPGGADSVAKQYSSALALEANVCQHTWLLTDVKTDS